VDVLSFVTGIEPPRHPYLGNVVTHDPARVGDAVYGSQSERHDGTLYNGALYALTAFPLQGVFQIGGIRSVYSKWAGKGAAYAPDYGRGYQFQLQGPAMVFVAKPKGKKLDWLAADGFKAIHQTLTVGHWDWPYRYRNRPPSETVEFDILAKQVPSGAVTLGPNATSTRQLPYIVFVQPALLAFENFRGDTPGAVPAAWQVKGHGVVVDVPDYEGEMRPSVFELGTVPRYRPLGLRGLKLEGGVSAALKFSAPAADDFILHARLKVGQQGTLTLCAEDGKPVIEVPLKGTGAWQNVTLRVAPARRTYNVEVQDAALHVVKTAELPFITGAHGPLALLKLTPAGEPATAWLLCNAVTAWKSK
jgi:hypothetical protein